MIFHSCQKDWELINVRWINFPERKDNFYCNCGNCTFFTQMCSKWVYRWSPNNSFSGEEEIHNGCRSRYHYSPYRWWDGGLQGSGSSDHSYDDLVLRLLIRCFPTTGTGNTSPCQRNKNTGKSLLYLPLFQIVNMLRVDFLLHTIECLLLGCCRLHDKLWRLIAINMQMNEGTLLISKRFLRAVLNYCLPWISERFLYLWSTWNSLDWKWSVSSRTTAGWVRMHLEHPSALSLGGQLSSLHHRRDSAFARALHRVCFGGFMGAKIPWAEIEQGHGQWVDGEGRPSMDCVCRQYDSKRSEGSSACA